MHYCPKTLLVEVGAQTNTVQEAKNAMVPLAEHPEQSTFRINKNVVPAVQSGSLPDFRN